MSLTIEGSSFIGRYFGPRTFSFREKEGQVVAIVNNFFDISEKSVAVAESVFSSNDVPTDCKLSKGRVVKWFLDKGFIPTFTEEGIVFSQSENVSLPTKENFNQLLDLCRQARDKLTVELNPSPTILLDMFRASPKRKRARGNDYSPPSQRLAHANLSFKLLEEANDDSALREEIDSFSTLLDESDVHAEPDTNGKYEILRTLNSAMNGIEKGRLEEVENHLEEAYEQYPNEVTVKEAYAHFLKMTGKRQEAAVLFLGLYENNKIVKYLEPAFECNPDNPDLYGKVVLHCPRPVDKLSLYLNGFLRFGSEDFYEAACQLNVKSPFLHLARLKKCEEGTPAFFESCHVVANYFHVHGDLQASFCYFEKAIGGNQPDVFRNYISALRRSGATSEKVEGVFLKWIERDPSKEEAVVAEALKFPEVNPIPFLERLRVIYTGKEKDKELKEVLLKLQDLYEKKQDWQSAHRISQTIDEKFPDFESELSLACNEIRIGQTSGFERLYTLFENTEGEDCLRCVEKIDHFDPSRARFSEEQQLYLIEKAGPIELLNMLLAKTSEIELQLRKQQAEIQEKNKELAELHALVLQREAMYERAIFDEGKWRRLKIEPGKAPGIEDGFKKAFHEPCPLYESKQLGETHMFVQFPANLTPAKLLALGYSIPWTNQHESGGDSHWLLVPINYKEASHMIQGNPSYFRGKYARLAKSYQFGLGKSSDIDGDLYAWIADAVCQLVTSRRHRSIS